MLNTLPFIQSEPGSDPSCQGKDSKRMKNTWNPSGEEKFHVWPNAEWLHCALVGQLASSISNCVVQRLPFHLWFSPSLCCSKIRAVHIIMAIFLTPPDMQTVSQNLGDAGFSCCNRHMNWDALQENFKIPRPSVQSIFHRWLVSPIEVNHKTKNS